MILSRCNCNLIKQSYEAYIMKCLFQDKPDSISSSSLRFLLLCFYAPYVMNEVHVCLSHFSKLQRTRFQHFSAKNRNNSQ